MGSRKKCHIVAPLDLHKLPHPHPLNNRLRRSLGGGAMRSLHGLMDTRFVRGGEDYFYNILYSPSSVAAGTERARA